MRSSAIAKTTINNTVKTVADNDDNHNEKNVNVFFERKMEEATEGLSPYYSRILFEKISQSLPLYFSLPSIINSGLTAIAKGLSHPIV